MKKGRKGEEGSELEVAQGVGRIGLLAVRRGRGSLARIRGQHHSSSLLGLLRGGILRRCGGGWRYGRPGRRRCFLAQIRGHHHSSSLLGLLCGSILRRRSGRPGRRHRLFYRGWLRRRGVPRIGCLLHCGGAHPGVPSRRGRRFGYGGVGLIPIIAGGQVQAYVQQNEEQRRYTQRPSCDEQPGQVI